MNKLSWTLPVADPERPSLRPEAGHVWEGLLHKAEHPGPYVPAVTACRILERYGDGFLREITVRDENRVRERVTVEPEKRLVFRPVNDPCIESIVNEIGEDAEGGTMLTLRVTLTSEGVAKGERTRYFLPETKRYFSDALQFIVDGLLDRHATR